MLTLFNFLFEQLLELTKCVLIFHFNTKNMADSDSDGHLKCIVKKAISLRVGNPSVEFKSGCSVIDVIFPAEQAVKVLIILIW